MASHAAVPRSSPPRWSMWRLASICCGRRSRPRTHSFWMCLLRAHAPATWRCSAPLSRLTSPSCLETPAQWSRSSAMITPCTTIPWVAPSPRRWRSSILMVSFHNFIFVYVLWYTSKLLMGIINCNDLGFNPEPASQNIKYTT